MVGGRERGQLPLNFLGPNLGKILLLQPSSQQTKLVINWFPGLDHTVLVQKPSPAMTFPPGKAWRRSSCSRWLGPHPQRDNQPAHKSTRPHPLDLMRMPKSLQDIRGERSSSFLAGMRWELCYASRVNLRPQTFSLQPLKDFTQQQFRNTHKAT